MTKVLVLSYYFPPCNLTAAQRTGSWQKYLHESGYFPIIVTRSWTGKELTEKERLISTGEKIEISKSDQSEIHTVPYKSSLRDYFFIRSNRNKLIEICSKFLTALLMFFQNFTTRAIPFRSMYLHADTILKNDPSIQLLIVSGNPFEQFYFGYLLKKKHPKIKWIADFRDEWTTSELNEFKGLKGFLWNFQKRSEQKWLKNVDLITANTNHAVQKLGTFHQKPTLKLLNGFDLNQLPEIEEQVDSNKLVIVHNGTLYPTQKLTVLCEGLMKLKVPDGFQIELHFPGIKLLPKVAQECELLLAKCPVKFFLTERIPQKEVLLLQQKADVLLMVAHEGIKGIVGSKLYEYIGLKKNVLLTRSDNDELAETLEKSNLGVTASTSEEVKQVIENWIKMKKNGLSIQKEPNDDEIQKFTRQSQTKLLASYFDHLLKSKNS